MRWFIKAITQNYANFSGRARRAEYWWFAIFMNIAIFGLVFAGGLASDSTGTPSPVFSIIQMIIALGLILPGLGVQVRRLHDIGKSGWFWLVTFIPCVGGLILLIWACKDSQLGDNQYGPNPKGIGNRRRRPKSWSTPQTGKTEAEE